MTSPGPGPRTAVIPAAPRVPAPTTVCPTTACPDVETFFVRENFEKTRRTISALLREDPTQAQDITQEAFVIAYERWDRVSRMDNPLAYVKMVAWRLALKWLRARKRAREVEAALPWPVSDGGAEAAGVIARVDLVRAFLCLSHAHQEVLALSMSGLEPQDIAPLLGIPARTVRTRLFRARKALAAHLEDPREGQS
ncbi:RNA polymerase sigma factor [Streptomyces sp. SP2-10]|uniref:RNA polymerase sigma factor n=1 Tax=Streptomyces sp. SP2-10 TaxID=2873385 RepID=UPI001CA73BCD|nr:sigma-70 family RNA polymerase sigma factor [Streptomyces sp. SP2-10]MBY8840422.1 sigma-70 family RNA polymerase sigma factor [Streptomyces sp. SP2-10]